MPTTEPRPTVLSDYARRVFQQEWQDLHSAEAEAILKRVGFGNRLMKLYPKVRHAKD